MQPLRPFLSLLALTLPLMAAAPSSAAEDPVALPPPLLDEHNTAESEKAVFSGGCFWGVQGVFQHVKGVRQAVSGYAGGTEATASYEQVSLGNTGHAESVEVTFDPAKVTYGKLLQIFFSVAHDPTQLNHQGPDSGTQYRSALFAETPEQEKIARAYIAQLGAAKAFPKPIVTDVKPLKGFYAAESEHQDFLTRNPTYPYIVYNDLPKIEALKSLFPTDFKAKPALVSQARLKS
ncbi:peptide-methionine (S)-S-oxide reductase [Xaviernesmea oryzae]|uniref:Peptide methionine sulfoxide reductase MsrA n=1 Tax=Xaviernesmea oryzae TaxID=464029 RepID=A0A1Q9AZV4_9HYPH|nr:peptide-methionine (S)-S-oxide reductase MsrA [Xaviernesmea oryzae]OLP61257.1 peptide-methionine (S)-S-oxide reductase [Xaviernesmea oryzae]SEL52378.1 peptide-methionine (S)-S-oxide reductase [Xaviernesmea oryzae]